MILGKLYSQCCYIFFLSLCTTSHLIFYPDVGLVINNDRIWHRWLPNWMEKTHGVSVLHKEL